MRIDFDRMTVICLGQFHVLESSLSVFDVRISLITILRFTGSIDLKKFSARSARGIYVKLTFDSINGYVDFVESILHSKTQLWYILVLEYIFHIAPSKLHHHT